jgi:hypothetical protein
MRCEMAYRTVESFVVDKKGCLSTVTETVDVVFIDDSEYDMS